MRPFLFAALSMLASTLSAQTVVVAEKPEFHSLVSENAALEKIATGYQFLEGPAWDPVTHALIFSDIPASRMYRFDPASPGAVPQVFREASNHANGNTFDSSGNLFTGEEGGRVSRTPASGGPAETLAERFEDKPLSSPNDVVVQRDGTVWFTDPTYGLKGRPREQAANRVYRLDPKTHELRAVAEDFAQPNGLCFSPDERRLYVVDSDKRHVRVFDVNPDKTLSGGRVFCRPGGPDGIRCDRAGNLWSSADDGVHVFNPAGEPLGKILVPETPSNLCFGGPTGNDLYIAARKSLYRIKTTTTAAIAGE